jgi:succinoglycan biosynthesis transport protein ExoP
MELGRYLEIIKRWWWLMVISATLAAGASYIYSQQQPRIYASRATLMVGTSIRSQNPNQAELGISRTLAEIYGELVRRTPITQAVIDKLGLEMQPEELAGMIRTQVIEDAQLLEITVLDVSPQRARVLANALANELILQSPTGARGTQETQQFIQSQLTDLQGKIEEVDTQIKDAQDKMVSMTSAADIAEAQSLLQERERLKRDYQSNYAQLMGLVSDNSINTLAIVEPASEPSRPVSPNIRMNVLVAAVAGLALAIAGIVLLEFFDDRMVWNPKGVQSFWGLPVLGVLSKLSPSDGKIVARSKVWSPEADSIRNVRTNILLSNPERELHSFLITSPNPGEGKSFTAANMAAITAVGGQPVTLIDADFRKPTLHEFFDMPNVAGLAEVLAAPESERRALLNKTLKKTDVDNLRLLPAGKPPIDPMLSLGSPAFKAIIKTLQERGDLVVVDVGPVLMYSDFAIIARYVDGVLMVARNEITGRQATQKAVERFKILGITNLLGLVFNDVETMRHYYGAYKRYYGAYERYYQGPRRLAEKGSASGGLADRLKGLARHDATPELASEENLSLNDVAQFLGVSEATAGRWCQTGRLPAVKAGRRWRVKRQDLDRFAQAQEAEAEGSQPLRLSEM